MRKNIANFAGYVSDNFDIVKRLIEGYEQPDAALNCGSMIRECIRHSNLATAILNSEYLWKFFDSYVHFPNFEVASDAFNSLRDLLVTVKNKTISSTFLETHFDEVFGHYEVLLKKGNYVTRRRALKLLGELLLDRSNFNVMIRFIASRDHLKVMSCGLGWAGLPLCRTFLQLMRLFSIYNTWKLPLCVDVSILPWAKHLPFHLEFHLIK